MAQDNSKTPSMILHEMMVKHALPPPDYKLIYQFSGSHKNHFEFQVSAADIQANGSGSSKQMGKQQAAKNALDKLAELGIYKPVNLPVTSTDDVALDCIVELQTLCLENKVPLPEYFEISSVGPPHNKEFTYGCRVGSINTQATSGSKKMAKRLAAKEMLENLNKIYLKIMMFGPLLKSNFDLKQIRPTHEIPVTFVISQWQDDKSMANFKYCTYRIGVFIIFFVSWVFTFVKESDAGLARWPIYLTNWGFTLCMVQALLGTIMIIGTLVSDHFPKKSHWKEKGLKMYPAYWVINTIATPVAFTISMIYWSLIYGAEGAAFTAINFVVHGLNTILMLIDLFIVGHPVRILHLIYPVFLAFCYTIFTIIFYVAGGTTKTGSRHIYPILKWDQPYETTGVCAGVMMLMIFLHICAFLLYKLRTKLYETFVLPRVLPTLAEKSQIEMEQHCYDNKAITNDCV